MSEPCPDCSDAPVIVIAPQGRGKTRHAEVLREMFSCTEIVDEWDGVSPLPPRALVLTNTLPGSDR